MLSGHGVLAPFGAVIHTTGDGPPAAAERDGRDPLEVAVEVYSNMTEGPHFVVGPSGTIVQVRDTDVVAWHTGVSAVHRRDFLSGHWENLVANDLVSWWKARWPGVKSPSHLYPGPTPNAVYYGIECVPAGTYFRGVWKPTNGATVAPTGKRNRFTTAQYLACAGLVLNLAFHQPKGFDPQAVGRVVGHEDLNPITRPGWDPGGFQDFWSWPLFWDLVNSLQKGVIS